jgi:WD40 repeat protein
VDEQHLTSALIQALRGEPRMVYALTGHGERDINGIGEREYQTIRTLMELENFAVQPLTLSGEDASVPEDADAVLILGPMAQLSANEVEALQAYLTDGGAMMLLIDPTVSTMVVTSGVQGVAYSHDGERIVSASADDTARVWDAETGEELLTLAGHTSDVLSAAFSPDDDQIATASADGTIRLWDAENGTETAMLQGHQTSVIQAEYSPAGDVLASIGEDQTLILWDLTTLEQIVVKSVQAPIFALAYSSDGRTIATGAADGSVALWDGATGETLFQSVVHTNIIFGLAFAPDDATVYSAALDGTIGAIDVTTGAQTSLPISPGIGITDLVFFPDGQLGLALSDNSVRVLSEEEGGERIFTGHEDLIWQIAIAPDGETFATAGQDGTVLVWSLDSDEPILSLTGHMAGDPLQSYLATTWGIAINDDLVVDLETEWAFDALTPVAYGSSYAPMSDITSPLLEAGMPTYFVQARSMDQTFTQPGTVVVTTLAQTSPGNSWGETNPFAEEIMPDEADLPGPRPLAMSAEDSVTGSRVVVIGDADLASNQALRNEAYANSDFFLNAANWLTREETLIDVRESEIERTFTPLSGPMLVLTLLMGVCIWPLLVLGAGLVVWLVGRARRA